MSAHGPYDLLTADPPYGVTTLRGDRRVEGWHDVAAKYLNPSGSLWGFGSLRYRLADARRFEAVGLRYARDGIWRKANGSGFAADRFKRALELAVQYYRFDAEWRNVYNDVQRVQAVTQYKSVRVRQADRVRHGGPIAPIDFMMTERGS